MEQKVGYPTTDILAGTTGASAPGNQIHALAVSELSSNMPCGTAGPVLQKLETRRDCSATSIPLNMGLSVPPWLWT